MSILQKLHLHEYVKQINRAYAVEFAAILASKEGETDAAAQLQRRADALKRRALAELTQVRNGKWV